jgi:hypothetical protein
MILRRNDTNKMRGTEKVPIMIRSIDELMCRVSEVLLLSSLVQLLCLVGLVWLYPNRRILVIDKNPLHT